ncbi:hypothetical protein ACTWJ9_33360 (plasmid) [Streptomyces sp. GDS52]|uniref:hypothetical protein n=1 Tax=Streptomyces sp. GDS52 TaxID=3406419 RepID=UPI003FD38482
MPPAHRPVAPAEQEIATTASRRSGPRKWLKAVRWLIGAGLHPKANQTTQAIADDLAARMDYDTGHVLYRMHETAARVDIDVSNVKRHVKYLRELGALAWVQHGTRTNSRRAQGLDGWAGTATIYAAVIPAVFDHAMGHRIIGTGYEARIVVDLRDRPNPVDNRSEGPVDNSAKGSCAPPSLTVVKEESQVQIVGGFTTTATRQRKTSPAPNTRKSSSKRRATILGAAVTAAGMQLGDKLARAIGRRVSWARRASHDQLRWVCADMGEQQWTEDQAVRFAVEAGFKHRAGFAWEPARPHRLIAAELRALQEQQQADRQMQDDLAQAVSWEESTAGRAAAARASLAALFGAPAEPEPERTAEDRKRAELYGWDQWEEVAAHYADEPDDALDLYGERLCTYAVGKAARREWQEAWA